MALKRGDIVLVPFPFADLSSRKVRPALIISPDPQTQDIILAFISSVALKENLAGNDFLLESNHPDFPKTGLRKSSVFKMNKLLTLHHSVVLRRLGAVSKQLCEKIDKHLAKAVGLAK